MEYCGAETVSGIIDELYFLPGLSDEIYLLFTKLLYCTGAQNWKCPYYAEDMELCKTYASSKPTSVSPEFGEVTRIVMSAANWSPPQDPSNALDLFLDLTQKIDSMATT